MMPVNKELLSKLKAKHGAAFQKATAARDPGEADRIRDQLPDLDVDGDTTVIIIPVKKDKGKT